jgi:peptidoglycan/xylan/chitin deacetylase (PgdA/CDA1 family)
VSWRCCHPARLRLWLVVIILGPVLVACGSSGAGDSAISWQAVEAPTPTAPVAATPPVPEGVGGESASPVAAGAFLTPKQLKAMQPNELGLVPVLEYHVITTNPAEEAQFVRTADDFRADLQWLYDHDFYVVTMREFVTNTIAAPAGKRPVLLTFDDGTSSQFRFLKNTKGELVPDPDTAVGILEAFFAKHPDFGHTAHFAILPYNCFAVPDADQMPYCDQKVRWLVDHGYEIGNHTMTHINLTDISTDTFIEEVGGAMLWARDRVGDIPANMSDVITLPYGSVPDKDLHADQRQLMKEGFWYQGQPFYVTAALLVGANPSVSPASTRWDPLWVPRIQMFDSEVEKWFGAFERGEVPLYVSDGNPTTITVPAPLPAALEGDLDGAALGAKGKTVLQYDPASGERASLPRTPVALASRREGFGEGPA